jgi:hypothetical protein
MYVSWTVSCLLLLLQIIHVKYSLDVIVFFVGDVTAFLGVYYEEVKERLVWRSRPSVLRSSVSASVCDLVLGIRD